MELRLDDCTFSGHALPEPFVKLDLEGLLQQAKLLPKTTGAEGRTLTDAWEAYRRRLRALGDQGGPARVAGHVLEPLAARLGYAALRREGGVITREGEEDGGYAFETEGGAARLRAFAVDMGADLDAPTRRGQAYRYSPSQVAQRVLLAKGERVALLTDGNELRLLLCDPARRESHIAIRLDRAGGWRAPGGVPDSYRLLLALCGPAGVAKIPDLVEQARLAQTRVTARLREQARLAVRSFVQEVLDDPRNTAFFARYTDKQALARQLYRDALVLVYRLLFILKLEASSDPARSFSFASVSLWRNTYSPTHALAPVVEKKLGGAETGDMVAGGLRALFRLFREGFQWSEMRIQKLGGMLFGEDAAPILDSEALRWSELAAAKLLGHLLWTPRSGKEAPMRVHYGPLYVEDLGRVYEALLELEPGIATEPMCRLRRQKLEVVVPRAQGEPYRQSAPAAAEAEEDADEPEEDEEDKPARGKTRVLWIEDIPAGAFYLRVGLGRKATGSYYTPQAFVKFLVQETLGPQVAERSPAEDPRPSGILGLKVLDPAMGSGHFLVEACRFLGDKLYEACRLCDGKAKEAEERAERVTTGEKRDALLAQAAAWRQRVVDLPDPNDEMLAYLPSRVGEGEESGLSDAKAKALCRRLVAVHCLYGVDKNPLAVELAKLSLWLESYAEGLPLTFLDHRLIVGDSLTGPFFADMATFPRTGEEVRDLFSQRLTERLSETLGEALAHVEALEASVGKDVADVERKRAAKRKLDAALEPFKTLAAAWSGGVMLEAKGDDDGYRLLREAVAGKGEVGAVIGGRPALARMVEVGREGVAYDLVFPEVFYPEGRVG
ncbi:MAG: N-6 DNA methylase, partial [Polyangiaceae bacterium]|nr:N-6 DNA methylase [Polyangiaceae bacterium]